jgi:hypothetical protein
MTQMSLKDSESAVGWNQVVPKLDERFGERLLNSLGRALILRFRQRRSQACRRREISILVRRAVAVMR